MFRLLTRTHPLPQPTLLFTTTTVLETFRCWQRLLRRWREKTTTDTTLTTAPDFLPPAATLLGSLLTTWRDPTLVKTTMTTITELCATSRDRAPTRQTRLLLLHLPFLTILFPPRLITRLLQLLLTLLVFALSPATSCPACVICLCTITPRLRLLQWNLT